MQEGTGWRRGEPQRACRRGVMGYSGHVQRRARQANMGRGGRHWWLCDPEEAPMSPPPSDMGDKLLHGSESHSVN